MHRDEIRDIPSVDFMNHYLEVPSFLSLRQNMFVMHRDEIRDISSVEQMAKFQSQPQWQIFRTFCGNYPHKEIGRNTT